MPNPRIVLLSLVALLCIAGPAAAKPLVIDHGPGRPAGAAPLAHSSYDLFGYRWPKGRITYYATPSTKRYATQIKEAVKLWNKSGAKVQWVPTTSRKAKVKLVVTDSFRAAGLAVTQFRAGRLSSRIYLRSNLLKGSLSPAQGRYTARAVITHEMGHVLGLDHSKGCTLMAPVLDAGCPQPERPWQFYCRIFTRDDLRGAVRLYGGKPGKLAGSWCNHYTAPGRLEKLTAATDPGTGRAIVGWRNPKRVARTVEVASDGAGKKCPTRVTSRNFLGDFTPEGPGKRDQISGRVGLGTTCYLLKPLGFRGHPGKGSTVTLVNNGVAPVPAATAEADDLDPLLVRFSDESTDADDDIVAWKWTFGDGATATTRNAVHKYALTGIYNASLTVTDSRGHSATKTVSVTLN